MPISKSELIQDFGGAVVRGAASLFIGAGLSVDSKLPTWPRILEDLRRKAHIPAGIKDLPLVAEYIEQELDGGRAQLLSAIESQIAGANPVPHEGHRTLSRISIDDVWTTNYDWMIELADSRRAVVADDKELEYSTTPGRRRLTKMHGSLEASGKWSAAAPVISRSDYELYQANHPRTWAALRATYLTKTFLFLGFSFDDPNIEVLLQLSRSLNKSAPIHYTVLCRPDGPAKTRLHDLRVRDLERLRIRVCEIDDFAELTPLLQDLERRSRRPIIFVTGSDPAEGIYTESCSRQLGHALGQIDDIVLLSFAGSVGMDTSISFANALTSLNRYDPGRTRFHFRKSATGGGSPDMKRRIGTAIYTQRELKDMRTDAFMRVRAVVAIGGSARTSEELAMADQQRLPVVPIATFGGAAHAYWSSHSADSLGAALGSDHDIIQLWLNLGDADINVSTSAASSLLRRSMFLDVDR